MNKIGFLAIAALTLTAASSQACAYYLITGTYKHASGSSIAIVSESNLDAGGRLTSVRVEHDEQRDLFDCRGPVCKKDQETLQIRDAESFVFLGRLYKLIYRLN